MRILHGDELGVFERVYGPDISVWIERWYKSWSRVTVWRGARKLASVVAPSERAAVRDLIEHPQKDTL